MSTVCVCVMRVCDGVCTVCVCVCVCVQVCGVDRPDQGHYPSHTFVLMVIHFLQQTHPPVLPVLHQVGVVKITGRGKRTIYCYDDIIARGGKLGIKIHLITYSTDSETCSFCEVILYGDLTLPSIKLILIDASQLHHHL